ncbi:GDSL-type esterase/lipase family protein [uncultured Bacteroides sp.]|uniref:GDSL-type esterase/lipase family protein n=1 Tax=uncultured Bacteroides sp. TaxID=162156 RepID=UPI002627265A|nr:GDSL-type esterase/lipase family protein [uncultured Bacteroides sp.]
MKQNLLIILFFVCSINIFSQERKYSTYYYQRATLFESLSVTPDDILFVGNSITDGAEWFELFDNPKVKNRGISGDTTYGVYDRISTLLKGHPKKIFLMIGINNVPHGESADTIAYGIHKIVEKIKTESPVTKIYLQSILPVNPDLNMFHGHTSRWEIIPDINKAIKNIAERENAEYIDLYSYFVNEEGKMDLKYTNDGLHLLGEGYLLWRDVVKPYINE